MRQREASTAEERREKRERRRAKRPYRIVSFLCALLFVGLGSYMAYFQIAKSEALLNSPYNKRTEALAEQVIRGSILARDGEVLAETLVSEDGEEQRTYPYGKLFAHTVGYLDYGSSGLESSESSVLLASHEKLGTQVVNELREQKKQGDDLVTTLDLALQEAAYREITSAGRGAVFAMDVSTGEVRACVSEPGFDPNTIVASWSELTSEESEKEGVFLNRATQGLYPPGSTFKIVTALAYLRQYGSFDDFHFDCSGSFEKSGFTIHCAGNTAHGAENFADAMANSCNCAFAHMASELVDRRLLRATADDLGFNKKLSLELPSAKSRFTLDATTASQLTMQTGIGQGETLATPMEMCLVTAAVANDGRMMKPRFVQEVRNADGDTVKNYKSESLGTVVNGEEAAAIDELLHAVTAYGTASSLSALPYDIAGKTGTAQYGDVSLGMAHSWYVGYSNTGADDICICVLAEGGNVAARDIAGRLFTTYFEEGE